MTEWPFRQRLLAHAKDDAGRVAYAEQATGRTITYGDLVEAVQAAAAADAPPAVVLRGGNRIDFVVSFLAALTSGRAVLPADVTVPPAELERLTALAEQDDSPGPAVLLASSGTTGRPKLVRRERAALDAVAESMANTIGLHPADRVLAAVPLTHSYGMEHGLLAPLWAGCTVLLTCGLDLPPVAAAWRAGATVFPAVPSMLELLLRSGLSTNPALRRVYTAGAPLPTNVAGAFERRYRVPVGQVYGMTEIGSVTYRNPTRDTPGTVGRAVRGVDLRIDEDGQLHVRSPFALSRYAGDATQLPADGYLATGDLARLSDTGELTLIGRTKLLIDVGGAKVNPMEVEAVLTRHPGVAACVVWPLALSETVRRVRAIVVPADPASPPTAEALRAFAREHLARHKVPRVIEFRDALPRTAAGKVARQLLETP